MKKLLLIAVALPLAMQAEPRAPVHISDPVPEQRAAAETNVAVMPAPGTEEGLIRATMRMNVAWDKNNQDLLSQIDFDLWRKAQMAVWCYSCGGGDRRQYRGERTSDLVGIMYWNRKIIALIEREIARRAIPQQIVDRYTKFKDSQFMQRIERQALAEFGFADARTAEEQGKVHAVSDRMDFIMLESHAERAREFWQLIFDIYPLLAKRIEALFNGVTEQGPVPEVVEVAAPPAR